MFSKMFNYFAGTSKGHLYNAWESASNLGQHSTEAFNCGLKTASKVFLGFLGYKELSGSVMTGCAFGFVLPNFAKVVVNGLASLIFYHPTATMLGTVAISVASDSENALKCVKNTGQAMYDAGSTVYEGALCVINGAAAAATFVYDNVHSTDVQLSGNAIEALL